MELNNEYYENEKRKIIEKRNKKRYNKEYYNTVRKQLQNIEKCRIYVKEYRADETIKVIIEEGKFPLEI
jgi:hypothetical protein